MRVFLFIKFNNDSIKLLILSIYDIVGIWKQIILNGTYVLLTI